MTTQRKKVAVFYPRTHLAGWSVTLGLVQTVARQHDVLDAWTPMAPGNDTVPISFVEELKHRLPSLEELRSCDTIIVSGPEHISPWLEVTYGIDEWKRISVPKVGVYHESAQRTDGGIFDFSLLNWCIDYHLFAAYQDAEFYGQSQFFGARSLWEPFCVDTKMFHPDPYPKDIPLAFIGSVYGIRKSFLEALNTFQHPPLKIGRCNRENIDGVDIEQSMAMMAADIRRMKVFFNLPSLSQLMVSKVVEVLACGTFLMTPALPNKTGAHKNMLSFVSGEHVIYYRAGNPAETAGKMTKWASDEMASERERIALSGMRMVHEKFSLDAQVERMIQLGAK